MDTVDNQMRSRIVASVRPRTVGPEALLRRALYRAGLCYSTHDRWPPRSPDLVFALRFKSVIFVHGYLYVLTAVISPLSQSDTVRARTPSLPQSATDDACNVALLRVRGGRAMTD